LAMVLMCVVAAVGEDEIRLDAALELLEPGLDLGRLRGTQSIAEVVHLDAGALGALEEIDRGRAGLFLAGPVRRQHAPENVEPDPGSLPLQQGGAGADLDIVGMRSQAQYGDALAGLRQPQSLHCAASNGFISRNASLGCHGISPRSAMSCRICLSLSVSIGR